MQILPSKRINIKKPSNIQHVVSPLERVPPKTFDMLLTLQHQSHLLSAFTLDPAGLEKPDARQNCSKDKMLYEKALLKCCTTRW